MRRRTVWPTVWAVIALVVSALGPAHAQETTTGSITGDVVDAQGAPIPGATVTLSSDQGDKTFVTDQAGRFFAPFLTPGRYTVRVELSGFSTLEQKNVDVRLGQRIELAGLALKVGGVEEIVDVVGSAPVVDTTSTTAGGVLSSDQVKSLPIGRQMTDTLYMVPGVQMSGMNGTSNPSMSGGSGLENNYVVDGVNITNSGYGAVGSYSIIFGSLGSGVTTDFIQETQVKTAGFEAEYGQATGGVVNVVTKGGSNDLHGSLYGYFAEDALESDWRQLQTVNGSVNTVGRTNRDFGATVGGPVVKDRLFFFGAFNPQYQTRTIIAPPNKPAASLGEVDQKRRTLSYAGKLTFQASTNHRLDLSAFGDPSHGELGPQRANVLREDTAAGRNFSTLDTYGGHNQTLRYDGILSRSWLIEASVARATNKLVEIPLVDEHRVTDATVSPSRISGGIGAYEQGNNGKNLQFSLKSTNIFDAGGNHQLRYGGAYEDIQYSNVNLRTGPSFTLPDGQQTNSGASITIVPDPAYGRIYRVTRANYDHGRVTDQKYLNFFVQDTWQVGRKLTLRPGLRWERQRLVGGDNPPLCNEGDSRPGAGDGSGEPVPCEFTFDNNWSPRLGATFDIKGDGKSKVYAAWGRFYSKIPNDLAARALSADAGVNRADYFDSALTRPIPDGVLAGGQTIHYTLAGASASVVDPDSRSTYSQELVGGVELELFRNVSFGVRYIHRSLSSILEDWQAAPVVAFDLGCPGTEGGVQTLIGNIG
ncbi:MAG TPA: TonB-dependent receptor, partial [Vicinamibacteria bacterium]|nr:TonB-dependent receptor [Vicinamibacteria bacterium]